MMISCRHRVDVNCVISMLDCRSILQYHDIKIYVLRRLKQSYVRLPRSLRLARLRISQPGVDEAEAVGKEEEGEEAVKAERLHLRQMKK